MASLTLYIIRHAEKPGGAAPGPGLTIDGKADDRSLVIDGWQRSGAWTALFGAGLGGADYLTPAKIFAADPNAAAAAADHPAGGTDDDTQPSQRPFETVVPLAARLRLTTDARFAVGQEAALIAALQQQSGVVLLCWEHKAIAKTVVPGLLAGQTVPGVPFHWSSSRFDVVLRLDRTAPGAPWSFRQLFPKLLAGDSDKPLRPGASSA